MSFIINNLECTGCDHFEEEAMYRRSEGPPKCPECGSERKMSFRGFRYAIHGQGPGSFAAVDFGVLGKAETKEDYDRCIETIQKRFPGKRVNIQEETQAQKSERLDTIRHNSWKRKKAKSLNDKILKEVSVERKALKAEGRKLNSSAAQLVGGK
jgi:hypothetical protein|tara:strand:- start:54 stop:515 length:462 start_codon:yes stop_codon:yes gene_type:complete